MKRPAFTLSINATAVAAALLTLGTLFQLATTVNAQKAPSPSCQNLPTESQLRQPLVQAQKVNKPIADCSMGNACGEQSSTAMGQFALLRLRWETRRK